MTRYRRIICLAAMAGAGLLISGWAHAQQARQANATQPVASSTQPGSTQPIAKPELRSIRLAVCDIDTANDAGVESAALTDQVNAMLSNLDKVGIVNRDQIRTVLAEHKLSLMGLADTASAVQLGKFLSANYIVVGRLSRIDQVNHLVLKIIDVGTTAQTTVSAQSAANHGLDALLQRLAPVLGHKIRGLQEPLKPEDGAALAKVMAAAKDLAGKVILVDVSETHMSQPRPDAASQMAVANRLRQMGVEVVEPEDATQDWKKPLLENGVYGKQHVDFVLEGLGTSAYVAQAGGLASCRATVKLRLIPVPGRAAAIDQKGVAAGADLVEDLAAETALENAGTKATDATVLQYAKSLHGG